MNFEQAMKLISDVLVQVNANLQTHQAIQQALQVIADDHARLVAQATMTVEQIVGSGEVITQ